MGKIKEHFLIDNSLKIFGERNHPLNGALDSRFLPLLADKDGKEAFEHSGSDGIIHTLIDRFGIGKLIDNRDGSLFIINRYLAHIASSFDFIVLPSRQIVRPVNCICLRILVLLRSIL